MNATQNCEREYDFALILTGAHDLTDEVMNALFDAGCDDATPSVQSGCLCMDFSRTAPSLKDAILTAIRDVRNAGIGADALRVYECDRVSPAEDAETVAAINTALEGVRQRGRYPALVEEVTRAVAGM